jgi:hypothetical protein
MQIEIGQGVDDIVFGMTEDDVVKALGSPDKIVVSEFGCRDLIFNLSKLVLKIEPENDVRLGWMEVHNKRARWADINPWTIERDALLELLTTQLDEPYELDDYGTMESYSFNESWVELQYEFNELSSFNFGVRYGANDEPLWPKSNA